MTVCDLEPFNYDQVPRPDDPTAIQLSQEQLQAYLARLLTQICALQEQVDDLEVRVAALETP
jgi:hypothetical protein